MKFVQRYINVWKKRDLIKIVRMRVKKNKFHLAAQVVAVFLHEFNDSLIRLVHEQE